MNSQTASQQAQEAVELPDECDIELEMQCTECGHKQRVKGHRHGGKNYFGSAYNWCDECEGLPKPTGKPIIREKS